MARHLSRRIRDLHHSNHVRSALILMMFIGCARVGVFYCGGIVGTMQAFLHGLGKPRPISGRPRPMELRHRRREANVLRRGRKEKKEKKDEKTEKALVVQIRSMLGSKEGVLQQELARLKKQMSVLDQRFDMVSERAKDSKYREGLLASRLTKSLQQEMTLRDAIKAAKKERDQVSTEYDEQKAREEALENKIAKLTKEEQEKKSALGKREDELESMQPLGEERIALCEELVDVAARREAMEEKIASFVDREAELKASLKAATTELTTINDELMQAREAEREAQEQLDRALERESILTQELSKAETRNDGISAELDVAQKDLTAAQLEEGLLAERVGEEAVNAKQLATDIDDANRHAVTLAEQIEKLQAEKRRVAEVTLLANAKLNEEKLKVMLDGMPDQASLAQKYSDLEKKEAELAEQVATANVRAQKLRAQLEALTKG